MQPRSTAMNLQVVVERVGGCCTSRPDEPPRWCPDRVDLRGRNQASCLRRRPPVPSLSRSAPSLGLQTNCACKETAMTTIWSPTRGSWRGEAVKAVAKAFSGKRKQRQGNAGHRAVSVFSQRKVTQNSRTEMRKGSSLTTQALDVLARPAGFEPTTPWFVGGLRG